MNEALWQDEVPKYVRVTQIIVGALVLGCSLFLAFVLAVPMAPRPGAEPAGEAGSTPLVSYIALANVVAAVIARVIVPGIIVRTGRRNIARGMFPSPGGFGMSQGPGPEALERMGDAGRLLALFQTKTIVAAAILEGAAFFLLIAYMIEHSAPVLAVAVAMIAAIAMHMPTPRGVIHWIEDQLRLLREEQSFCR